MKEIKIKDLKEAVFIKGKYYLYALGEDGYVYFMVHDTETNSAEWQRLPLPPK